MSTFRAQLNPVSRLKYLAWQGLGRPSPINLALRSGARFQLRPRQAGTYNNNDYGVAYEIFVHNYYSVPEIAEPDSVRLVVDLGGNAGFSTIHWLETYRNSSVVVFEPHPQHVGQIRTNVMLNNWENRILLYPNGASNVDKVLKLSNQGSASTMSSSNSGDPEAFEVALLDIFPILRNKTIDIFKIDIEGGEYSIMEDERFPKLDIRVLLMEWHQVNSDRNDGAWCRERLLECGFAVKELWSNAECGMLRAIKLPATAGAGTAISA